MVALCDPAGNFSLLYHGRDHRFGRLLERLNRRGSRQLGRPQADRRRTGRPISPTPRKQAISRRSFSASLSCPSSSHCSIDCCGGLSMLSLKTACVWADGPALEIAMLDVVNPGPESALIDLQKVNRSFAKANGDELARVGECRSHHQIRRDCRIAWSFWFGQIDPAADHCGPCQALVRLRLLPGRGH